MEMDKKELKAFFNMMCEEDEVYDYDQNGITYYDFTRLYNEAIDCMEEYGEYDSDEDWDDEQPVKKKKPVKVGQFLHAVGNDGAAIAKIEA